MLKRTLADRRAFIFLGLLSSVMGDGGVMANNIRYDSLPFVTATFTDKCPDHLDPLFCNYWNSLRYKITDSDSSNFFKTKQIDELRPENKTSGNEASEENLQEEISLELPFISPENHLYKRFTVFRRKNPIARGYKRGPGFRSWGGKRDLMPGGQNFDKKSKFASWGGKRDEELLPNDLIDSEPEVGDGPDKRPKFQNWGGKKSTNDILEEYRNEIEKRPIWKDRFYLSEPFKKHVPKRPQFQSWGGKRGFYPWHGLFEFLHSQPRFLLNAGEKRKFSSWGGKRYDFENQDVHWMKNSEENSKRNVFQNWEGKKTTSDLDSSQDVPDVIAMKEFESSEKIKQRDKRKVKANWKDEENISNLDSSGDERREGKNRR